MLNIPLCCACVTAWLGKSLVGITALTTIKKSCLIFWYSTRTQDVVTVVAQRCAE